MARPPRRPPESAATPSSGSPAADHTTESAPATTHYPNPPPQSEGVPMRLFTTGGPTSYERMSVAMKVLLDPVARNSFTRPYSGQARNWNR
jgi:hypothetical protein